MTSLPSLPIIVIIANHWHQCLSVQINAEGRTMSFASLFVLLGPGGVGKKTTHPTVVRNSPFWIEGWVTSNQDRWRWLWFEVRWPLMNMKKYKVSQKKVWITTCNRSSNSHFFLGHLVVLKKVSSVEQSWWLFSWFFEHSGETNPCPQLEALDRSPSSRPVHLLEHDVSSLNLSLKTVHDTKDTT